MSSPVADPVTELRELRHELGNALTAATTQTQFLVRRLSAENAPREHQALLAVQNSLLRAVRLLHTGPVDFPSTRCDLRALVGLASSQVPPERAPDLVVGAGTEPPLIARGHPERIVQVLANLLDNAVKYSLPGTPIAVETYWVTDATRDWAVVSVSDQGIGIDPEAIEAVFLGHRTSTALRTAPGSGLGLQLSRRLMEAEGGKLWATGTPGGGTTFYAESPLARVEAEEPTPDDRLKCPADLGPRESSLTSLSPPKERSYV
jgi:signal transduction histidine kinase